MREKNNSYNDILDTSEEYFKNKDNSYEDESEEYFPQETLIPPHY
tara:strand:- start:289 stop:423 length:135 start_codon:yes stop_codon:yes gene_type:complete